MNFELSLKSFYSETCHDEILGFERSITEYVKSKGDRCEVNQEVLCPYAPPARILDGVGR